MSGRRSTSHTGGSLRWTRRSSRHPGEQGKATIDMEPVIQTEKDARRPRPAQKPSAALEGAAPAATKPQRQAEALEPSAEGGQRPDVELSTFVTAAEHAREGEELQSLTSGPQLSQVCWCTICGCPRLASRLCWVPAFCHWRERVTQHG